MMKPKRRRRRSHSRKKLPNCLINLAEARKEISNALQYHHKRSSASKNHCLIYPLIDEKLEAFSTNSPTVSSPEGAQLQGLIGPTWVKTESPVDAGPTPILETLEYDHDESSLAASYRWWAGFLESLDGKNHQESMKPVFDDGPVMLGQAHEWSIDDSGSSTSCSSLDEWLDILNIDEHNVII